MGWRGGMKGTDFSDVDAGGVLAVGVPVAKLGDDRDGIEAGVLGERRRDDLERVGEGLEAVGLHALERLRVLREQTRDVDLGRATSDDEGSETRRRVGGAAGRSEDE